MLKSYQFGLVSLFLLLATGLSIQADPLGDTYLEIRELETQLEANKKTVAKKIAEQRTSNPLYAEKSPFEVSWRYF